MSANLKALAVLVQPDGSLRAGEILSFACGPLPAPEIPGRSSGRASRKGREDWPLAGGTGPVNFSTPRREGPRSVAEWFAPWKRSFCSSRQDRNKTVSCRGLRHGARKCRSLWLRSARTAEPPLDLALALLPLSISAKPGSQRLRLAPQVGSQPPNPVRQNITWHREV